VSLSKLPSGRWRSQVWSVEFGRNVSVSSVLGPKYKSFASKAEAKAAREEARRLIGRLKRDDTTVGDWFDRWTTDPLWQRPKESTNRHNRERVRPFCEAHKDMPLTVISDDTVALWLRGGKRNGQVPALRAMFNDAASAKAGRLVKDNPFANLGLKKSRGNRDQQPPSETMVLSLIGHARDTPKVKNDAFADWLQVACFSGLRPGELDALRPEDIDLAGGWIRVSRQFNVNTGTFTTPKNGLSRLAPLTPQAREVLDRDQVRRQEFCFENARGGHFTAGSRAYHWKAVSAAAGWNKSLYLATRHFFGWYAINVLLLPSEDVAIALGHTDGGELVRRLYGHRDQRQALERVQQAFAGQGNVRLLRNERQDLA